MTSSPLVVALDIGTSSVRALAFDTSGAFVEEAVQHPYEQHLTGDGCVEIDAQFLLELAAKCLDELLPRLKSPVIALATSCFWHSLLAVSPDDSPRSPVWSWADNRSAPYVETLRAQFDETASHAQTGTVFHTSFWPAKLRWARHTHPQLFVDEARWMGFGEWLTLSWCGEARASLSMVSATGLWIQNENRWHAPLLEALGVDETQLPMWAPTNQTLFLKPELAKRWPALQNAQIFAPVGDGACSNLGSGCASGARIGLNAGTSGALRVVLPDFQGAAPRGLWRYRVDERRSIVGGALSNAGNLLVWARQTLNLPNDWPARIDALAPDSHGLTVLPFLAGERAPIWNAQARFTLEGAGLDTSPLDVLRAILEAGALRFAEVGRRLLELAPDAEIVYSGGALDKVPVWARIVCDALGAPLVQSAESEASARGAALLALEALGFVDDIGALAIMGARLEPNAANHAIYERALERQNGLYEKIYG